MSDDDFFCDDSFQDLQTIIDSMTSKNKNEYILLLDFIVQKLSHEKKLNEYYDKMINILPVIFPQGVNSETIFKIASLVKKAKNVKLIKKLYNKIKYIPANHSQENHEYKFAGNSDE